MLEFAEARDLVVANTWFTKKEKQMVTYESGGNRSMLDYILVRKRDMRMPTDATVIQNERESEESEKMLVSKCGGGLIDFDDVSAAVDGFWSGCRGLSLIYRLCHMSDIQSWH